MSNDSKNGNKYKDFLPENRSKQATGSSGGGLFSPKLLKKMSYVFYGMVFFTVVGVVLHFNGYDILKVEDRDYNISLAESIDLRNMYKSDDVEWASNNENVTIKNNVVTALKSGTAYLYAQKDGRQVKDCSLTILTGQEQMSIVRHSMMLSLRDSSKIRINGNYKNGINQLKKQNLIKRSVYFFKHLLPNSRRKKAVPNSSEDVNNNSNPTVDTNTNNTDNNVVNNDSNVSNDSANTNQEQFNVNSINIEDSISGISDEEAGDVEEKNDNVYLDHSAENVQEADPEEIKAMQEASNQGIVEVKEVAPVITDTFNEKDFVSSGFNNSITVDSIENVDDVYFEYKSSNSRVAEVDENGVIKPISPGTTTIIVTDEYGNEDRTIVTVKEDELTTFLDNYKMLVNDTLNIDYVLDSIHHTEKDIQWTSDNEDVVSVDNTGKVTALGAGEANINIKVGEFEKTVKVEVLEDAVLPTDVNISESEVVLETGTDKTLSATTVPANTDDSIIGWAVENDDIALVVDGRVIAKSVGSTWLYAIASNGVKKRISVNVKPKEVKVTKLDILIEAIWNKFLDVKKILSLNNKKTVKVHRNNSLLASFDGGTIDMQVGDKKTLTITITPENATNKIVKVYSDDNYLKVTTNDNVVTIEALKVGTSNLLLESLSNNDKYSYKVNVTSDVTGVTINKKSFSMIAGTTESITATLSPSSAANKNITWTSSNTSIATVAADKDNNSIGVITAKAKGSTTITATSVADPSKKASITVTVFAGGTTAIGNTHQVYFLSTSGYLSTATSLIDKISKKTDGTVFNSTVKDKIDKATIESQSILIKSSDGQLALLDTGSNKGGVCDYISDQIHKFAEDGGLLKNNKAVLKYLFISHYHNDHMGCAISLINSDKLKIEKIITKRVRELHSDPNEKDYLTKLEKAAAGDNKNKVKVTMGYTTNSKSYPEGKALTLGKAKLYLFNNSDVFSNKSKCTGPGKGPSVPAVKFFYYTSNSLPNTAFLTVSDGKKYVAARRTDGAISYFDETTAKSHATDYYLAKTKDTKGSGNCNNNTNSIAILAEFPTDNAGLKYAYFPSDLENNGYSFFGNEHTTKDNKTKVYGTGTTFYYNVNAKSISQNLDIRVKVPAEYDTAVAVANKIKANSSSLNNLLIYQNSHHGKNDDPASLKALNLINRSNLYVVRSSQTRNASYAPEYKSRVNLSKSRSFYTTTLLQSCSSASVCKQGIKPSSFYRSNNNSKVILSIDKNGYVIANRNAG